LKELAADAAAAAERQDTTAELIAWRASLDLLPQGSRQYATIAARVAELSRTSEGEREQQPSGHWKWLAALGPAGLLLWKFKFLIVAVASKAKLLMLGLTKASTFTSMLLAFGVYWTQWGMWFAAGLVLSIYVHEMGHVAALRRYGIAASAPMFIPGLGALIRMKQRPVNPREDARIGLAGPIWGLGATLVRVRGRDGKWQRALDGDRAHQRVDQSLQPAAGLAARRRPLLRGAHEGAALGGDGGDRRRVVHLRRRVTAPADDRRGRARCGKRGARLAGHWRARAVRRPRARALASRPRRRGA
jgi:Peptidase family M50